MNSLASMVLWFSERGKLSNLSPKLWMDEIDDLWVLKALCQKPFSHETGPRSWGRVPQGLVPKASGGGENGHDATDETNRKMGKLTLKNGWIEVSKWLSKYEWYTWENNMSECAQGWLRNGLSNPATNKKSKIRSCDQRDHRPEAANGQGTCRCRCDTRHWNAPAVSRMQKVESEISGEDHLYTYLYHPGNPVLPVGVVRWFGVSSKN